MSKIHNAKKPKSKDNHVGIEIEFQCPVEMPKLAKMFQAAGLNDEVQLKEDGSINEVVDHSYRYCCDCNANESLTCCNCDNTSCVSGTNNSFNGFEVAVLCKEETYRTTIGKVLRVLKDAKCKVDSSCGLHVHIDMRNRDKAIVFNNLIVCQPILYSMNPKSRWNGDYCQYLTNKDVERPNDRYSGINNQAIKAHNTIEVRIHAGTLNKSKICNWVKLLLKIANKETKINEPKMYLVGVSDYLRLDERLRKYISDRIDCFNKDKKFSSFDQY